MPKDEFDPNNLLDTLLGKLGAKNDAALARLLDVAPAVLSRIRHHKLPVGASLLVRANELTNISIRELRELMGDRRDKFRAFGLNKGWATKDGVAA